MPGYDLPFCLIRHVLGASRVPRRDEGENNRPCKLTRLYEPGLTASREFTKGGTGVKRSSEKITEPDKKSELLSHMMWSKMYDKAIKGNQIMHAKAIEVNRSMYAHAIEAKHAVDKVVREELAKVTSDKVDATVLAEKERKVTADKLKKLQQALAKEAVMAGEVLKSANRDRDEQERAFRDYRATAETKIAEMTSRAEAAESSLATAKSTIAIQQEAGLKLETGLATLQEDHLRLKDVCDISENNLTTLKGQLSTAESTIAIQQEAGLKLETGLAAVQEEHLQLKATCGTSQNNLATLQGQHALLQQEHVALQGQHAQEHSALMQRVRTLEAQLAGAPTQQPLSAQAPAQLQPVLSWVTRVARFSSPSMSDSVIIDHVVQQGNDMAALEATVKEVQAEALRAMPQFLAFVRQGPAGWVPPTQADPVPAAASAPTSAPAMAPASASSSASALTATSTSAALGAPSVPAAAPTPASLGARAVNGAKSQQSDQIGATSGRSRRRVGR